MFLLYWTLFFTGYEAICITLATSNWGYMHVVAFILQFSMFLGAFQERIKNGL